MASKVSKDRLVNCPKCRQLLMVTANVYVYRCGGCNATLQSRKPSGSGRGSSTGTRQEADPVLQKNESGHEDNESITSSNQTIICPTDTNCGKGPVESIDCGNNMPECRGNSSQISTSGELNRCTKEAVVETGVESDCLEGRNPKETPVTNGQLPLEGMHLNAISSSDELNYHGKEVIAETGDNGHESDPLVNCPKCCQLLTVTAIVYLYRCGGCNATLQSRKKNGSGRGSSTGTGREIDPVQKNESGHEDNESITSSNQTIICPTDTNGGKGPVECVDCGNNMPECRGNSVRNWNVWFH